jgi:hypothetical protein
VPELILATFVFLQEKCQYKEKGRTTFYFNDSEIEVRQTYIEDGEKRDKGRAKGGKKR